MLEFGWFDGSKDENDLDGHGGGKWIGVGLERVLFDEHNLMDRW